MFTLPRSFSPGEARRWRRVGGLVLAEVHYAPGQRVEHEAHAHARFVLVLEGALTSAGKADGRYPSSTLLFRAAGDRWSYEAGASGAACLVIDMDDLWLARARQQAPLIDRSTMLRGGLVLHLAERLFGEFTLRDEVSRLAIESLALGVLAEASRRAAKTGDAVAPAFILRARDFADRHFAERLLLATVAAMVGVHPVHLARTFRRVYDTTFTGYVRDVRLEFARRQLKFTSTPLGEIALAAGFCDQSHFCRHFRRATGLSPAEYRHEVRSRL